MGALDRSMAAQMVLKACLAETNLTAAGTGDATEVDGISLDIRASNLGTRAECAVFTFWVRAANTATKVVAISNTLQYSVDGSTWVDITKANGCGVDAADIALGSDAGTGTVYTVLKHNLDLTRIPTTAVYIRCQTTPDSSASGTDTATVTGTVIFMGLQQTPQN